MKKFREIFATLEKTCSMADKEFAKLDVCAADEKTPTSARPHSTRLFCRREERHGADKRVQNEYKHTQNRQTGRSTDTANASHLLVA